MFSVKTTEGFQPDAKKQLRQNKNRNLLDELILQELRALKLNTDELRHIGNVQREAKFEKQDTVLKDYEVKNSPRSLESRRRVGAENMSI
jgi:hypothetical protein